MKDTLKSLAVATGWCFLATELAGLLITIVPVTRYAGGGPVSVVLIGVLFTALPAIIFSLLMAIITSRLKVTHWGYLWSVMLVSICFLGCVPSLLYFHPPLIPDYRLMESRHYFLWGAAVAAGVGGTWALNLYWAKQNAQQVI